MEDPISQAPDYDEADFVEYAFGQSGVAVVRREGKYFDLAHGFRVEVERRDLYRLSFGEFVISPFDDIGKLCSFIKKNAPTDD